MMIEPEYITAICTAAYVAMTLVIIMQNRKDRKSTQSQFEELNRPNVILYLVFDRGLIVIRIHNVGNRLANEICITTDKTIEGEFGNLHPEENLKLLTESNFELGPGTYWDLIICRPDQLPTIKPSSIDFKIEYEYEYIRNNKSVKIESIQTIHFDSYFWSRRPENELVPTLKSIEKAIKDCNKKK